MLFHSLSWYQGGIIPGCFLSVVYLAMYLDRAAALSGLHVLSALRSYKLDQFLEESVRQCSSSLVWMQFCSWSCYHGAWERSWPEQACFGFTLVSLVAGFFCPYPFSCLYSEHRHPALFTTQLCSGHKVFCGHCPRTASMAVGAHAVVVWPQAWSPTCDIRT